MDQVLQRWDFSLALRSETEYSVQTFKKSDFWFQISFCFIFQQNCLKNCKFVKNHEENVVQFHLQITCLSKVIKILSLVCS